MYIYIYIFIKTLAKICKKNEWQTGVAKRLYHGMIPPFYFGFEFFPNITITTIKVFVIWKK